MKRYILAITVLAILAVWSSANSIVEEEDVEKIKPLPHNRGRYIRKSTRAKKAIEFDDFVNKVKNYEESRISKIVLIYNTQNVLGLKVFYEVETGKQIQVSHFKKNLVVESSLVMTEVTIQRSDYINRIKAYVDPEGWINYLAIYNQDGTILVSGGSETGTPKELKIPKNGEVIAFGGEVGRHLYNLYVYYQQFRDVKRTDVVRMTQYWDDHSFDDMEEILKGADKIDIAQITVLHNKKHLSGIKLKFNQEKDGKVEVVEKEHYSSWWAMKDGAQQIYEETAVVREGECISKIVVKVDHPKCLNYIALYNNHGFKILEAGDWSGEEFVYNIPKGGKVIGFKGEYRGHLNQLAVYYKYQGKIGKTFRARRTIGEDDVEFDDFKSVVANYEKSRIDTIELGYSSNYIELISVVYEVTLDDVTTKVNATHYSRFYDFKKGPLKYVSATLNPNEYLSAMKVTLKSSNPGIYKMFIYKNDGSIFLEGGEQKGGNELDLEVPTNGEIVAFAGIVGFKHISNLALYYIEHKTNIDKNNPTNLN